MKNRSRAIAVCVGLFVLCRCENTIGLPGEKADYRQATERMLDEIVANHRHPLAGEMGPLSKGVLDAMRKVPRHEFVPEDMRRRAYIDSPLPIGDGQTISQPYIVALMTELAKVEAGDVVLEIGTGSGYQAAVLSRLVKKVFTIEIIQGLADTATKRLRRLGYADIHVKCGDGYFGWKEHAPYDAILVTAASKDVPPPLVAQLKKGGRMIIPVGEAFSIQSLVIVEKGEDATISRRAVLPVRFVPLTGGH